MFLNPELVEWVDDLTRGVRVLSLKKLVLFMFLVKGRMEKMDWAEWVHRNPELRSHGNKLEVYLGERDMVEVRYYTQVLGWSLRTVFDYWETLWLLYASMN